MTETTSILHESINKLFNEIVNKKDLDQAETGIWADNIWKAVTIAGYLEAWDEDNQESNQISLIIGQASGWHALPVPLVETMAARHLSNKYLNLCPDGPLTIANPYLIENSSLKNSQLTGIAKNIPFARHANQLVTVVDEKFVLAPCNITQESRNIAGESRDNVSWENSEVIVGPKVTRDIIMETGAIIRSSQICGALHHALQKSTTYATERKQFGRQLGKFQSIQNYLAKMASLTAMAEAALSNTAQMQSPSSIAAAKICASEAAGEVASLSHRIHGAIGFTHEYSLHHLTRRLLSWREEFGAETWWQNKLGKIVIKTGSENLWKMITSEN
tara:strand:+ start:1363 stop:2358 length:996 start_codon:yes stop_codon:yes gene_type:complete